MYNKIINEIREDAFYENNFSNDGQRFVAWYLRRVLLLDVHETRAAITDGPNDRQIDAIVVEDGDERRIRVIQGKFVEPRSIDAGPLREVLSAWTRFKNLPQLQLDASGRLAERLEAVRQALEDDYDLQFELLTTGDLTGSARADFDAFKAEIGGEGAFSAGLTLVDAELIETRLADAEQRDLPELSATITLQDGRFIVTEEAGYRVLLAFIPLTECLKLPGISDGKLFRRNVRQSLGLSNKVNKAMRATLVSPEKAPYFFFFHNGITALCDGFTINEADWQLKLRNLSVVNGCQSLSTIYQTSGKVAEKDSGSGSVLFRFYEIPRIDLSEAISINTNSQSAVKPRDLRSNDKVMRAIKKRYEAAVPDGYFITKRGEVRPPDRDPDKTVDATEYGKMVISWLCQRPNMASNEKRLFDEHYNKVFHPELNAQSILALRRWLSEIDRNWNALDLNEAIKAVKGAARFHMLFVISQLFAHASKEATNVPIPSATMPALKFSGAILAQAKGCLNQALSQAVANSVSQNKVFSPQNWLKGKGSVSDEQLVASTIVNVLQSMQMPETLPMISSLSLSADQFSFRWTAD